SLSVGDGGFGTDVFDRLRFPVRRVPSGEAAAAVATIEGHAPELAAVVLEPLVQGASGMLLNEPAFVKAIAEACARHDVLLICDEVATGFGRTGTLFAVDQCGVRPDLLCLGKGLTGGYLAMAATAASARVYDAFLGPDLSERTLYHGHSFSGNALASAVALRHLQLLSEWNVLDNVRARADQLRVRLSADVSRLAAVREVRQVGLMTGIELAPPADGLRWGRRVSAACVRRGVLIRPLGDVIVLMPPLTITADEIDRIVDTVLAAIDEVAPG
ncbi:MAG TPA: aminotransferase class III-fold pyridoxal phosphate-dependent enzyme, partial [Acidimicrobiales bacterium]|nr:aminotransferase class III-fold pyridoxal phosphate-dependent enzyme [Acidimicrobiales bacterium]